MLWSTSGIREARKEIGSAQPCWSKKLGGLWYIGQIRLGGSIVVHVSQLHFLVDYLPLGGRRRGFTPRASVSSSITHRCVVLVFASLFPHLCLLFSAVDMILNWLRQFINSIYLVLWEVVRKEPISHWLMIWSSSGIREARKEIGSAQPRWSKKLGGLRYIGQIRLGGSIVVHVSQLHFLVDYLLLGGWRRGFTPRASVSSSITHRVLSLCLYLSSLNLCHLISTVHVILFGLDCLSIMC